jgi:hypothetical protein
MANRSTRPNRSGSRRFMSTLSGRIGVVVEEQAGVVVGVWPARWRHIPVARCRLHGVGIARINEIEVVAFALQ